MTIKEICDILRAELYNKGFEIKNKFVGFALNWKTNQNGKSLDLLDKLLLIKTNVT